MFGKDKFADWIRFFKAFLTNQFARIAPKAYVRLVQETGRGLKQETVDEVVDYCMLCFDDYFKALEIPRENISSFLNERCLLEIGPGDVPGVALLMIAYGAKKVICVDRFPLLMNSNKNLNILRQIMHRLPEPQRIRAEACFNHKALPESGLNPSYIDYRIEPSGCSGLIDQIDLIYSRATLEHVGDLKKSLKDMQQALVPGGLSIHKVDLKSHGLHRENPLDFLTWPEFIWRCMYDQKGVPNRVRVEGYRKILTELGLVILKLDVTESIDRCSIDQVRPYLAKPFKSSSDEDLYCLGFWLAFVKPNGHGDGISTQPRAQACKTYVESMYQSLHDVLN